MPTATSEVIRRLTGFGSNIQEFVQSREGGRLQRGQVDEGFCKGVCIDWTRRVLQGGGSAFTVKEQRKTPQTVRQATIQLNIESRNEDYNKTVAVRSRLVTIYNQNLAQNSVQLPLQLQTDIQEYIDFTPVPNRTYDMDRVGRWLTLLRETSQQQDHTTEVGWQAFVTMMDGEHLRLRREQVRSGSNRPFSHIRIIASRNRTQYAGITAATDELLQLDEFVASTVLLLGFGLTSNGRDTGHAVAVHRVDGAIYRLLDPNYGVFQYSLNGVASALRYLFGTAYGTPIYGEDGDRVTGAVSYILFARA